MYASRMASLTRPPAFAAKTLRSRSGEETFAAASAPLASFLVRLVLASVLFQACKLLAVRFSPQVARKLGWVL
jgi:hypothetical protein